MYHVISHVILSSTMVTAKMSGKQMAKGEKEIFAENARTLKFYKNMITGMFTVYRRFILIIYKLEVLNHAGSLCYVNKYARCNCPRRSKVYTGNYQSVNILAAL